MRALVLLAALVALPSFAGERYLGIIISAAGADTTNATTATPFVVPEGSKLTFNCTIAANVCVDTSTACTAVGGANPGVPVAALTNFPTSVSASNSAPKVTISTVSSRILRIFGAAAVSCTVWYREGNE